MCAGARRGGVGPRGAGWGWALARARGREHPGFSCCYQAEGASQDDPAQYFLAVIRAAREGTWPGAGRKWPTRPLRERGETARTRRLRRLGTPGQRATPQWDGLPRRKPIRDPHAPQDRKQIPNPDRRAPQDPHATQTQTLTQQPQPQPLIPPQAPRAPQPQTPTPHPQQKPQKKQKRTQKPPRLSPVREPELALRPGPLPPGACRRSAGPRRRAGSCAPRQSPGPRPPTAPPIAWSRSCPASATGRPPVAPPG
jgi:hypothetical protein